MIQQRRKHKLLVTGSAGLIGMEVCRHFADLGWQVTGIDNNQRAVFFGPGGDTSHNVAILQETLPYYEHHHRDIRDRSWLLDFMQQLRPDAIVHTAAQPSHDRAADIPFDDFDTNAVGTLNLLEAARRACPESPFVHMSTNKVYGDKPNNLPMTELETRWEYADHHAGKGIDEHFSIDQSKHSVFGAGKVAADVMVQEYGRYFGMPTACLRGGCLTGPHHSGVQLHGFLQYLVKCQLTGKPYTIFGYKGKQVRDNIHSKDVARFIEAFIMAPRRGEVYNIGGGFANTCSILEAFAMVEKLTGKAMQYQYSAGARQGDHICYYSDLSRIRNHYPEWDISISLDDCLRDIVKTIRESMVKKEHF